MGQGGGERGGSDGVEIDVRMTGGVGFGHAFDDANIVNQLRRAAEYKQLRCIICYHF